MTLDDLRILIVENSEGIKQLIKVSNDHERRIRDIEKRITLWIGAISTVSIVSGVIAHYILHL